MTTDRCPSCGALVADHFAPCSGTNAAAGTVRLDDVNALVNALCICGGRGPEDDPCPVCELWHLLRGHKTCRRVGIGEAALAMLHSGGRLRVSVDGGW